MREKNQEIERLTKQNQKLLEGMRHIRDYGAFSTKEHLVNIAETYLSITQ
jgi:hypothetical protein